MQFPKESNLLCLLILWRLISVFIVQTAHVPDEYWQSLEVAHRLAFGYGYLTWEWKEMIRSYLYPFLISILYRILAIFSLDSPFLLTTFPRVFQAILVGYSDYRFYKWIGCKLALMVLCTNWYWYYCATRTLINAVETACTIIACSMFPWTHNDDVSSTKYVWIISFLCMARPTAAIIWLPLCLYHICTNIENKSWFLIKYITIGLSCFLISVLIDSYCYGRFVITPLKFFDFNVLRNVGSTYGEANLLWYFTIGLPVLLGLYCIPFVMSVWRIFNHFNIYYLEISMFALILSAMIVYSILPHKEFRFILPLLPFLLYISSVYCCRLNIRITSRMRWNIATLLIWSNLLPGIYFSLIHQRGTLDVMNYLRDEISHTNTSTETLILTPCHATPLYSHLHINTSIKFLTCEPNIYNHEFYMDEADQFFKSPSIWLNRYYHYTQDTELPTYVIAFDNIVEKINTIFLYKYEMIAKIFHMHYPETNYGKYILLYKRNIHA